MTLEEQLQREADEEKTRRDAHHERLRRITAEGEAAIRAIDRQFYNQMILLIFVAVVGTILLDTYCPTL